MALPECFPGHLLSTPPQSFAAAPPLLVPGTFYLPKALSGSLSSFGPGFMRKPTCYEQFVLLGEVLEMLQCF